MAQWLTGPVDIPGDYYAAAPGELLGDESADSAGRPRHQGDLAVQALAAVSSRYEGEDDCLEDMHDAEDGEQRQVVQQGEQLAQLHDPHADARLTDGGAVWKYVYIRYIRDDVGAWADEGGENRISACPMCVCFISVRRFRKFFDYWHYVKFTSYVILSKVKLVKTPLIIS